MENENKFINLTVKKSKTREFKLKDDEYGYSITIDYKLDGTKIPKDGEYTFLLSEKRLSKVQPKNKDEISFWLFKDENIKIQKSIKNPETGKWTREIVKICTGSDILKLCKQLQEE